MLFSTDKEKYAALGAAHPEWPVFMQAWWLDAVCGGRDGWECILLLDGSNRAVGAMPYFLKKTGPVSIIRLPPLTPWLGIWARLPEGVKPTKHLAVEKEVFSKILSRLPDAHLFLVNFHWSLTNWLPFHWAGFQNTARVTHLLDCSPGPDFLWKNFRPAARKNIQKAARQLTVSRSGDLYELHSLLGKTFFRKGLRPPCSFPILEKLDGELAKRGQRQTFFARDAEGHLHAAVYLIWDATSADILLTASEPELRRSGAVAFLYFEVMKFLSEMEGGPKLLDFEGSMVEEIEVAYRSFGARQRVYPQFFKAKNKLWQAAFLLVKKISGR